MTTNTATTTVTCPRCHGFENAFTRFGHIAHGRCLQCLGAKTIEVSTAKLNSARAGSIAAADAYYSTRPYCCVVDGCDSVGNSFATWEAARAWLGDGKVNDFGEAFRIAKWNGKRHCYRDGTPVKFGN